MIPIRTALLLLVMAIDLTSLAVESGRVPKTALSPQQQGCLGKGKRFERAGWIYLHVEGEAHDRGFQHGYLLAREIAEGLQMTRASWEHESGMDWTWLINE